MFHVFWFGLEILRLFIKSVFWNIERFLSYLTFYPLKKVAPPLIRVLKKFLRNWVCRVTKEAEFCTDFKNVQKSRVWQNGKKFFQKNLFLGTWKILRKILGTSYWHKSSTHFWNQLKILLLLIPCTPNFEEIFFSTFIRDGAVFLEVKSSNKIETDQYFKKHFL
jgi:hypothetical protein